MTRGHGPSRLLQLLVRPLLRFRQRGNPIEADHCGDVDGEQVCGDDFEFWDALVDSIRRKGVKQPIEFAWWGSKPQITDGHHRLNAAHEVGLKTIPVQVDGTISDEALAEWGLRLLDGVRTANDVAKAIATSLLLDAPEMSLDELLAMVDGARAPLMDPETREQATPAEVHKALENMRPHPTTGGIKVYHATDPNPARVLLRRGLIPEGKLPFRGEEYGPGRGIDAGLYVGADPRDVESYGRVTLEVTVPKSMLFVATEQAQLGETDPMKSLRTHDGAVVHGRLPPESFRVVEGERYLTKRAAMDSSLTPDDMTVDEVRAVLRGIGLNVVGPRVEVVKRLQNFLAFREMYHGKDETALSSMTVPQLRDIFRSIDRPVSGDKKWLMLRLQRLLKKPLEPVAPAKKQTQFYNILWTNPLTGRTEALTSASSRADAEHKVRVFTERYRVVLMDAGKHLSGLSDPDVRIGGDAPEADGETLDILHEIAKLEQSAMGPALSGDLPALRRIEEAIEKSKGRIHRTASGELFAAWLRVGATEYVPMLVPEGQRDFHVGRKPTVVWRWSAGAPTALSRPIALVNAQVENEGHDWRWTSGRFRYSGSGNIGDVWLLLQYGDGNDNVSCPSCGKGIPEHAKFCPFCGKGKTAKKSPSEKEESEAERLIRKSPKLKPSRDDKKREHMDTEPDEEKKDKDLSLNYKDNGG